MDDLSPYIQHAFDKCRGILKIPTGSYPFAKPLVISQRLLLQGEGLGFGPIGTNWPGTELLYTGGVTRDQSGRITDSRDCMAITIGGFLENGYKGVNGIVLSDLSLNCNRPRDASIGFYIIGAVDNLTLQRIAVSNFYVEDENGNIDESGGGIYFNLHSDVVHGSVSDVLIQQCSNGINFKGQRGLTTYSFKNCKCASNKKFGIWISNLSGSAFYSCVFDSNASCGVYIDSRFARGISFYSTWIERNCLSNPSAPQVLVYGKGTDGSPQNVNFYNSSVAVNNSVDVNGSFSFESAINSDHHNSFQENN